jgi:uncharacterized membrane protein YfcA
VSAELLFACGALLVAATIQSATGFGFALVAGPALYAVTTPTSAVALVLLIGQVVNVLVLFGERRRPTIDWTAVRPALAAAIPGLPIGALIITVVPATTMRIAVGVIVAAAVIGRFARRGRRPPREATMGRGSALAAGFAVGVLTTSTTTNGPPLAIWLTARRMSPAAIRDAVTVIFFVVDIIGIAALLAVAGTSSLADAGWIPALVPVAIVGHLIGRQAFLRLPPAAYEPIVLTTALAAAVLAIATGIAATG